MDKRTRVLNAMNKMEVDHVPVGFWFHFGGEEAAGEACVRAHLNYYQETDLDFLKVMCDGYFAWPLPEIREAEDWNRVEPLPADHPFIREQVERAAAIVKEIGKERCVFYNVFAPFSSLRFGIEAAGLPDALVMEHVRKNRNAVMRALDAIARTNALLAELLITEAGCEFITACRAGNTTVSSRRNMRESCVPPICMCWSMPTVFRKITFCICADGRGPETVWSCGRTIRRR